jgi:DNA polymerase-3 subunit beta
MQLVKTERDTLLRPLQTVSGIVERRHTLPILANLLITKNGPDVSFLSTDLEIQITTRADFGVGGDQVATTVAPASCWTSCARCLTATSRCRSPTSG